MRGFYLLLFLALVVNFTALGQAPGDFRSATSGPWHLASTWETFDGALWNPAVAAPTDADGVITIVFATQVDITTTVTADDIFIEGDAILNVLSGGRLIVANGAAADDVYIAVDDGFGSPDGHLNVASGTPAGILENRGYINSTPTNLQVDGTVIHTTLVGTQPGSVPYGSWNTGSLLEIQGITTGTAFVTNQGIGPGQIQGQSFYNFRWNCTGQSGSIHLQGHLTSVAGNFEVASTGAAGTLLLTGAPTLPSPSYDPLNIGGNFTVSGNGAVGLGINTSGIGYVVNVTGNLVLSSSRATVLSLAGNGSQVGLNVSGTMSKINTGQVIMATTAIGPVTTPVTAPTTPQATFATLDVNGDITWTNGNLVMATGTNTGTPTHACVGRLNTGGNLQITAGSWREDSNSSNGRGEIYFDDNHTHTFTTNVTITPTTPFINTVNFFVPASNRLNLPATSALTGGGTFTLSSNGTLGVGSSEGLVNSTGNGNIRVSGFRIYTGGNIVYMGSVAQDLGLEWSFTGALNNVAANLEIDNAAGVTVNFTQPSLPPNTTLVGKLTLTNGGFDIGGGNILTVRGDYSRTNGTITGHDDSSLVFDGPGLFTPPTTTVAFTPGFQTLQNFTIDRGVDVYLGSNLSMHSSGALIFRGSGNLRLNGNSLTINGDITRPTGSGAIASSNAASNLTISGSGSLTILPICGAACGGNQFNNVTFNRGGGASYGWSGSSTINGTLALLAGTLTHNSGITMATNSTFQRGGGTTFTLVGAFGATSTYNVSYTGALNPTGPELPTAASNRLNDLWVGDDVTLDKPIRIAGTLNLISGTLHAGINAVEMNGASIIANGGQFDMAVPGKFTFSRAGTTTMTGSTIGNITFGDFTINPGATVSAPNANMNIGGTWQNDGTFLANSGEVTFNAAAPQDIDGNGQSFYDLTTSNGVKSLIDNLDVNNTLTIETGSTLNASTFTINLAGQWTNQGTFNAGSGTLILDGTTQTLNGFSQAFNNLTFANSGTKTLASIINVDGQLTINSGVTLDVSVNNYQIDLSGNFVNNGTFNANNGTVVLDGLSIQTLGGTTNTQFRNLTIANPSTVTVSTAQSITDALTLNGGIFNPNGNFTMISTATRDARIAQLGPSASISTSMTVQRWLPNTAVNASYRYLASPMLAATVNGWKDDFPITGTHSDPSTVGEWPAFPTMNVNGPSLYRYVESTPVTTLDDRYQSWPQPGVATTAAALDNGRGYAAFVRPTAAMVIELVGVPATGAVPVTLTNRGVTPATDGWNLIGNPYASPINWNNVTIPAGVVATATVKDNTNNHNLGAGQYVYYTQGVGGNTVTFNGTIAQGQGFWVRYTTPGSTVLTFQEDDKQATSTPPFVRDADKDILRIHVTNVVANNPKADELLIHFREGALDISETNYDAEKLKNDFINFSSLSADGKEMAINTFSSLSCSREIPLILKTVTPGPHKFTFSQAESFSSDVDIRLLDTFTGQTVNVNNGATTYDFQVTTNPASFGTSRFKMFIGYKSLNLGLPVEAQDACSSGNATIKIQTPQTGVSYYATVNGTTVSEQVVAGNGSEVILSIPTSSLSATDDNTVVLMAKIGGCSAMPLSSHATINVKNVPVISGVTNASNCSEASLLLKASGAPADGSYKWYLTEDATDAIAGETASSFLTPVLAKTKTYFVAAVNALGCEGARMAVTASITYPYDITGVTNAESCAGSSMTLSATGAPEGGAYRWYTALNSTEPISNQNSASFTTPALNATTTYFVAAVNATGCEGTRVPVVASVNALPGASITIDGDMLVSGSDTGNQWYLNGVAILGATGKTYLPVTSGIYKLVVTSGNCSAQIEKEFAVTGDITGDSEKGYVLYPNPTSGTVYVEVNTVDAVRVSVRNQLGSEITGGELKQEGQLRRGQFDISGQANGVYLVVIRHGEHTVIRKIVKY